MIAIALKGRQRQVAHSYSHAEYFDRTRIARITRILCNSCSPTFELFESFVFNIYNAETFDRTRISRITRISHNRSSSTFGIFVKFVFNIYHAEYFDRTRISRITRISHNSFSPTFGIFVLFVFNKFASNRMGKAQKICLQTVGDNYSRYLQAISLWTHPREKCRETDYPYSIFSTIGFHFNRGFHTILLRHIVVSPVGIAIIGGETKDGDAQNLFAFLQEGKFRPH